MKFNIENYESMTPEEKVAALEAYEPDMSGFVPKSVLDKTASEAALYKKQLRERMSEEEAKRAQDAEEIAAAIARAEAAEARTRELEAEKTVNGYVNGYLALGYDEKLARATAEALSNGDMETVFKNQRKFSESREQALRTELLQQTPPPVSGNGEGVMGKDAFAKMTLLEKQEFAAKNPEVYASFYANKEE